MFKHHILFVDGQTSCNPKPFLNIIAFEVMKSGRSSLDAVVEGITVCELKPCARNPLNPNVGFGGK